jgi:hypothetical protein
MDNVTVLGTNLLYWIRNKLIKFDHKFEIFFSVMHWLSPLDSVSGTLFYSISWVSVIDDIYLSIRLYETRL